MSDRPEPPHSVIRRVSRLFLAAVSTFALIACVPQTSVPPSPPPGASTTLAATSATLLPPFPADKPKAWVCRDSPPPVTPETVAQFCKAHPRGARGRPAKLGVPATLADLAAKNAYDEKLQRFLSAYTYKNELGWFGDKTFRLTGPVVGNFDNEDSYGVHPAVRIFYSPEIIDWLCDGRKGKIPDGAMIVKEMRPIDPSVLGIDPRAACMRITKTPNTVGTPGWAVMVRDRKASQDGWYWSALGPLAKGKGPGGNPPIHDKTAVTVPAEQFFGEAPAKRNPKWYPTGNNPPKADVVVPYNEYGAYCLNCHASAKRQSTYVSFDNILTSGLLFRHFSPAHGAPRYVHHESGAEHTTLALRDKKLQLKFNFPEPRGKVDPAFVKRYGKLGPTALNDALALRFPAETYDHLVSGPEGPRHFLTSDNCIGCHDATNSNSSTANMLVADGAATVNVSPYGEWRVSPMGLAGRDPIFYSQLESETNHLPDASACIQNTCLHCHGVMGQRQFAMDTARPKIHPCRSLFALKPPPGVPFGKPFLSEQVTRFQNTMGKTAKYGALARDGISCAVCHRIAPESLGEERSFTGNFLTLPPKKVAGPYADKTVVAKPMEHALGVTPGLGKQIKDSAVCGTCHNILLPTFRNDGQRYEDPKTHLSASYEQSTDLEWQNSVFARPGPTFKSCQDCHMPTSYGGHSLKNVEIANIESSAFAPTTERLPDRDIKLTPRRVFARHSLHGLNLFLNQMFQQFPLLLGLRQTDYMVTDDVRPALLTGQDSIVEMAKTETASAAITRLSIAKTGELSADVTVTNWTGHDLPSGVGFRRLFVEFTVEDAHGKLLFASGRTNALGVILNGTTEQPLLTERGVDSSVFQPHYQTITRGNQVQIYQELIEDSDRKLTTSFLRRVHHVKDNRLRPKGFDPEFFLRNSSPYIRQLGEIIGAARNDPHYFDPSLTGSDTLTYEVRLTPRQAKRVARVRVRLFSQSIPPFYLEERFSDANAGQARKDDIRRLYYLTSHLNVGTGGAPSPINDWKLLVAESCTTPGRKTCGPARQPAGY